MANGVRLLLLESYEVFRRGLTSLLSEADCVDDVVVRHDMAGVASSPELLDRIDVAVMSPWLEPEPSPQEVDVLRDAAPVIVPLLGTDPFNASTGLRWRADGYFDLRHVSPPEISALIKQVSSGHFTMPRQVARSMWGATHNHVGSAEPGHLTNRERQVLKLLLDGLSNKQIALQLGVSLHGAKRHVSSIISKYHCTNRGQVIAKAVQSGLTPSHNG
jgi:DNA-binding NarL/FixJ family response regulator